MCFVCFLVFCALLFFRWFVVNVILGIGGQMWGRTDAMLFVQTLSVE
jgi:hypothetical protein